MEGGGEIKGRKRESEREFMIIQRDVQDKPGK
jgi:hypothetical protein